MNSYLIDLDRASNQQKTTISKPGSVISGSSFSVPISYYDQTTPYGLDQLEEYGGHNDFIDPDDFGEGFNFDGDEPNDSSSDFQGEIVQAFNPYVKVINFFLMNCEC